MDYNPEQDVYKVYRTKNRNDIAALCQTSDNADLIVDALNREGDFDLRTLFANFEEVPMSWETVCSEHGPDPYWPEKPIPDDAPVLTVFPLTLAVP